MLTMHSRVHMHTLYRFPPTRASPACAGDGTGALHRGSGKRGRKHSDKGGEGEGEDAGVAAGVSPQKADGDGSSVAKKKKKKKKSVAAS